MKFCAAGGVSSSGSVPSPRQRIRDFVHQMAAVTAPLPLPVAARKSEFATAMLAFVAPVSSSVRKCLRRDTAASGLPVCGLMISRAISSWGIPKAAALSTNLRSAAVGSKGLRPAISISSIPDFRWV
ncbi:hypothetical protein A9975_05425 [Cupriavidus sp. UME77]|nr:hypothetical protein [Cupriavidus sp. UME77]